MKISQAAKVLGVSPTTVRRLEKEGVIKPERDRNGWRRFDRTVLDCAKRYLFPSHKRSKKR